jgi:hypothetical protein
MKLYEKIGAQSLQDKGFTIDFLKAEHGEVLKRLRLASDMGDGLIPKQETEDPLDLDSVAAYVIYQCIQWPYPDNVEGIDMRHWMQEAACRYAKESNLSNYGNVNRSRIADYAMASINKDALKEIRSENLTEDIVMCGISLNPEQVSAVPKWVNEEVALKALKINPSVFGLIPQHARTDAVVNAALTANGLHLGHLTNEERTLERCELALKSSPGAIAFVPKELQSVKMIAEAVSHDGLSLEYLDEHMKTDEVIKAALSENPHVLLLSENYCRPVYVKFAAKTHPEIKKESWFKEIAAKLKKAPADPDIDKA